MKSSIEIQLINNIEISIKYIISKRKSIAIKVLSKNGIEVKAPYYATKKEINRFINKKSNWIIKHCNSFEEYDYTSLFYLGIKYTIKKYNQEEIRIIDNYIMIPYTYNNIDIYNWFNNQTKIIVTKLYDDINFIKTPSKILIKRQKKRWGTCTSAGNIYLNGLLSMCKIDVIEYILYHELCHLVHMNHSKEFYKLLSEYCVDYKEKKKWLKENQQNIRIDIVFS